jgi:glutamine phosphoribosylpyrophosphate amidotransferase
MCGIIGKYKENGLTRRDIRQIDRMFIRAQCRGTDAAGAFSSAGLQVKGPGCYDKVLRKSEAYQNFLRESIGARLIVGHTRMATQGDPAENRNNHPFSVQTRNGVLRLVHNGYLFDHPIHETDTWQIVRDVRAAINHGTDLQVFLEDYLWRLDGCAVLVLSIADEVFFARIGYNTLVFDEYGAFASTKDILGREPAFKLTDGEVFKLSL